MRGKLFVISGFSGSGKGTIVSDLLNTYDNFCLSISATTRKKREYEEDGVHYFFKTINEFEKMIKNNELLEFAKYADNYYGTPKKYVFDNLEKGNNVILEIEQQGAFQIKKIYNDAILIFLTTKDFDVLHSRLVNRNTETEENIKKRFEMAIRESENAEKYDYIIVNDTIKDTVEKIYNITKDGKYIKDENSFQNNLIIINNINEGLRRYLNV